MTCRKIIPATVVINFLPSPGSGSSLLPHAPALWRMMALRKHRRERRYCPPSPSQTIFLCSVYFPLRLSPSVTVLGQLVTAAPALNTYDVIMYDIRNVRWSNSITRFYGQECVFITSNMGDSITRRQLNENHVV